MTGGRFRSNTTSLKKQNANLDRALSFLAVAKGRISKAQSALQPELFGGSDDEASTFTQFRSKIQDMNKNDKKRVIQTLELESQQMLDDDDSDDVEEAEAEIEKLPFGKHKTSRVHWQGPERVAKVVLEQVSENDSQNDGDEYSDEDEDVFGQRSPSWRFTWMSAE